MTKLRTAQSQTRTAEAGLPALAALGPRICILGPSGSGKSTLAYAIARQLGRPAVHLDTLYHLPDSDWTPRPVEAFLALHEQAIAMPQWVMDGNYSVSMPARLARASAVIVLDIGVARSLWRYVRRAWFETQRHGGLDSGRDSVKWHMIRHICRTVLANRARYRDLGASLAIPVITLSTVRAIDMAYRQWGLIRP